MSRTSNTDPYELQAARGRPGPVYHDAVLHSGGGCDLDDHSFAQRFGPAGPGRRRGRRRRACAPSPEWWGGKWSGVKPWRHRDEGRARSRARGALEVLAKELSASVGPGTSLAEVAEGFDVVPARHRHNARWELW